MKAYSSHLLERASWYSLSDSCISKGKWYLPGLSDPAILLPHESPDGIYHLFSHSCMGIQHYTSTSGIKWEMKDAIVFFRAHYPFIYKGGEKYYMLFERHGIKKNKKDVTKNASRIFISSSEDLKSWTKEKMILDSSEISLSSYRMGPCRASRPCIVFWKGRYLLYFGAGECCMSDTGEKSSARLLMASSALIEGPYKLCDRPILDADPDSAYRSLATGSVRIYPCSDALFAVECAYFYDKQKDRSRSVMLLLKSTDGINFSFVRVMHSQSSEGFASRAITAAELKYMESENTWYCYYSANNKEKYHMIIKDSLGLLLGRGGAIKE